jgi:hypothetical protein
MPTSFLPLALIAAAGVLYHVAQKGAAKVSSPWPILAVAYASALVASALLWWLGGRSGPRGAWGSVPTRSELVAAGAIGVAAFGIETGFFLAYRAGWALGTTSLFSNLAVTALLTLIGALAFGEALTLARAAGMVIAGAGAWMMLRA